MTKQRKNPIVEEKNFDSFRGSGAGSFRPGQPRLFGGSNSEGGPNRYNFLDEQDYDIQEELHFYFDVLADEFSKEEKD